MSDAPAQWVVGATTYNKVAQDNVEYAVPQGRTVDDRDYLFIIRKDPKSNHIFFVQATTRCKVWELPDQAAPGAQPLVPQRSLRDRVLAMYQHYNPEKVGNVDIVIEKYGGEVNGENLLEDLKVKYGPEPPIVTSNSSSDIGGSVKQRQQDTSATTSPPPHGAIRQRVMAIYMHYNPGGVSKIDMVLQKYSGIEEQLIVDLVKKYGPEPSSPPPVEAAVAASPVERTYRERVFAIYSQHKPAKAAQLTDKGLETYKGQEQALIDTLVAKYGPEPPVGAAPATAAGPDTPGSTPGMGPVRKNSPTHGSSSGVGDPMEASGYSSLPEPGTPGSTQSPGGSFASNATKKTKSVRIPVERTYRERVLAIYMLHKPAKAAQLTDKGLETYKGQEQALIDTLVAKYGPEPAEDSAAATAAAGPNTALDEGECNGSIPNDSIAPPPGYFLPTTPTNSSSGNNLLSSPLDQQDNSPLPAEKEKSSSPEAASATAASPREVSSATSNTVEEQKEAEGEAAPKATISTFDFGDKNSNAEALSAARAEVAKKGGNQEQLLVTFIQDRDNRLREAHTRAEQVTHSLDELRAQTQELQKQLHQVKTQAELEISGMKTHAGKVQDETDFAKQNWELEREKLKAQADVAALVAEKTVQQEKLQFEQDRSEFQQQQAQLEETLATLEADIHEREQQSSRMLELLDTKDKDVRGLNEELALLKAENRPVPTAQAWTQTEEDDKKHNKKHTTMKDVEAQVAAMLESERHNPPTTSCSPQNRDSVSPPKLNLSSVATTQQNLDQQQQQQQEEDDAALFAEYESLMEGQRNRRDELEEWKRRSKILETEVQRLRQQSVLEQSQRSCRQCAQKIKVVMALRNNTKAMEKKISELEMNLLAIPDVDAKLMMSAGGQTASELLSEKHSLESQCNLLQKELSESKSTARSQRREIADLRGLLSIHRSSPAGGLRAVLGANNTQHPSSSSSKSPAVADNKKNNANSSSRSGGGTMGSAGRGL